MRVICLKTVLTMAKHASGDVSTSMLARIGAIAMNYYIMQHDIYNLGVCLLEMELRETFMTILLGTLYFQITAAL